MDSQAYCSKFFLSENCWTKTAQKPVLFHISGSNGLDKIWIRTNSP